MQDRGTQKWHWSEKHQEAISYVPPFPLPLLLVALTFSLLLTSQMMLGGSHKGDRLSKPYKSSVTEPEILDILGGLIKRYSKERDDGEHFGDWTIRAGIIKETTHGTNFWEGAPI